MPDFSAGPLENTCVPNRSATAHELARGRHGVPFAMTGVQDKLPHHSVRHHHDGIDHARKNQCIEEASAAGVRGAALGVALSAPAVAAAHHLSRRFRSFSVSTKTGLIVTPFFGLFFLNSELAMNACAQRRKEFAATAGGG